MRHFLAALAVLCALPAPGRAATTTWGRVKAAYHGGRPATYQGQANGTPDKMPSPDPHPPGNQLYTYAGGPNSLPYSAQTSPEDVVEAARALGAVQPALADYAARGFVRRPDLDRGSCWSNGAYAVLAWETPGVAPTAAQPVIVINTVEGETCYSTAVFGGMAAMTDSVTARFVAHPDDPNDPAFAIEGIPEYTDGAGAGTFAGAPPVAEAVYDPYQAEGADQNGQPWISAADTKPGGLGTAQPKQYKWLLGHTPCYWGGLGASFGFIAMAGLTGECPPVSVTIGCLGYAFQHNLIESHSAPGMENCP